MGANSAWEIVPDDSPQSDWEIVPEKEDPSQEDIQSQLDTMAGQIQERRKTFAESQATPETKALIAEKERQFPEVAADTGVFPEEKLTGKQKAAAYALQNPLTVVPSTIYSRLSESPTARAIRSQQEAVVQGGIGMIARPIEAIEHRLGMPRAGATGSLASLEPEAYSTGEVGSLAIPLAPKGAAATAATKGALAKQVLKYDVPMGGVFGGMEGLAQAIENPNATAGDYIKNVAMMGAAGAAMGGVIGGPLRGLLSVASRQRAAKEAVAATKIPAQRKAIAEAEEVGVKLTAADVLESKPYAYIQKFLNWIPGSAGIMERASKSNIFNWAEKAKLLAGDSPMEAEQLGAKVVQRAQEIAKRGDDVGKFVLAAALDEMGADIPLSKMGEDVQRSLGQWQTLKKQAADEAADAARDIAGDRRFETSQTTIAIKSLFDPKTGLDPSLHRTVPTSFLQSIAGSGNPEYDAAVAKLAGVKGAARVQALNEIKAMFPPGRNMDNLMMIKSALGRMIQSGIDENGVKVEVVKLMPIMDALKGDLDRIGAAEGGDLGAALSANRDLTRERYEIMDLSSIKSALTESTSPENVIAAFVKPKSASNMRGLDEAIRRENDPDARQQLVNGRDMIRRAFGNTILGQDIPAKYGDPKHIRSQINKFGIETVDQALGKGAYAKLQRTASDIEKENVRLSDPFLKEVLAKGNAPQSVIDAIIKKNAPSRAAEFESTFGREIKDEFTSGWLARELETHKEGVLPTPALLDKLDKKYGEPTLRAWLGDDSWAKIQQLRRVGHKMDTANRLAGNVSGSGKAVIAASSYSKLMNAFGKLAVGIATATPAMAAGGVSGIMGVLVAPPVAAKLYTSKMGTRWMTEGLMRPEGAEFRNLTKRVAKDMTPIVIRDLTVGDVDESPQPYPEQEFQSPYPTE